MLWAAYVGLFHGFDGSFAGVFVEWLGRGDYVEWFRLCGAVCGVSRALSRIS